MTNINIEIPEELHKKIKLRSVIEEKTLKGFIIEKLEEKFKQGK